MILQNPVRSAKLRKYPNGNIWQYYGENPALYQPHGLAFHNGIDIATFDGDEILAAHNGIIVELKNTQGGYGYHIRIVSDKQSDGTYLETTYGHLRVDIPVKLNDRVVVGQCIGYESNTGYVISGQSAFWGNAPAGKGVHLHFGLRLLADLAPGDQIAYSNGQSFTILNYKNGVHGHIDPMPYLNTMYTLYKDPLKTSEIYAFGNNYKRHISNLYTIRKGKGKEWEYENEATIPFADITLFANTPEAEEICFLVPDNQV